MTLFAVATFRARVFPHKSIHSPRNRNIAQCSAVAGDYSGHDVALAWLGLALLSGQKRSAAGTTVEAQPRVQ